jgi:hypothetical protein
MLAVIAGLFALGAFVWLWGGLAGALFGGGWPRLRTGQLPAVLVRLPARLSDPAAAWPVAVRRQLPGAAGFYGAFALLAGCGAAAVAGVSRTGLAARLLGRAHGARWASGPELRVARLGAYRTPRAGRYRGRLLCAEERHALVAFGPPQSGKSAGPPSRRCSVDGPAIASSIKTDLLACTSAAAGARAGVGVRPVRAGGGSHIAGLRALRGHVRRARVGVAAGGGRRA